MAFQHLFAGKSHSQIYKTFRPNYSKDLFSDMFKIISPWIDKTDLAVAVDVGCGSGQATQYLGSKFDCIIGIDPAVSQVEEAKMSGICIENGDFIVGSSEHMPLKNESCDYIQVFEAAHWFNLPNFYKEVDRVLKPGGVLVLGIYANSFLEPERNQELAKVVGLEAFDRFNEEEDKLFDYLTGKGCFPIDVIKHVRNLYREMEVPYSEHTRNFDLKLKEHWNVERFVAYLSTWSGWQQYIKKNGGDASYLLDMEKRWKDIFGNTTLEITWPVGLLVSRKPV